MKKTLHIICCLILAYEVKAQDIHFSQFFETPLWRNPSLAGIFSGDIRAQAVYRDQWNYITQAYRTISANAEIKLPIGKVNDFITFGLQALQDRAGTVALTTTHVLPALNYHKSLSSEYNRYLSLGFMGGWVQRRMDPSKATTNTSYNGGGLGENLATNQYSYIDGSVGMSFNSNLGNNENNNYYIGAAYHHFNRPKASFFNNNTVQIQPKWVFSGGIRLTVTDFAYITIQADHSRQGAFRETVAGGMYGIKLGNNADNPRYTIHVGNFLRWNDALIPVIKIDFAPFSACFSYDANISTLRTSSYGRGGFEISLSYIGYRKQREDYLLCPRF